MTQVAFARNIILLSCPTLIGHPGLVTSYKRCYRPARRRCHWSIQATNWGYIWNFSLCRRGIRLLTEPTAERWGTRTRARKGKACLALTQYTTSPPAPLLRRRGVPEGQSEVKNSLDYTPFLSIILR